MTRQERKQEKARIKEINWYIAHLNRECNIAYENVVADDRIYATGQQYAAMMSDILEYYKTKNPKVCEAVIEVINKYGKTAHRFDPHGTTFTSLVYVIQLTIPEEVGVKIEGLYNKMKNDKKAEQTALVNKLDELSK